MIEQQVQVENLIDIPESQRADGNSGLTGTRKTARQFATQPGTSAAGT